MDFNYLARTQTQLAIKTLKQYKFKEKDLISKRNIDFKSIIGILNSDIAENKFNILYTLAEINRELPERTKVYNFQDAGWKLERRY